MNQGLGFSVQSHQSTITILLESFLINSSGECFIIISLCGQKLEAANYILHKIDPGKINVIGSSLGYTKPLLSQGCTILSFNSNMRNSSSTESLCGEGLVIVDSLSKPSFSPSVLP